MREEMCGIREMVVFDPKRWLDPEVGHVRQSKLSVWLQTRHELRVYAIISIVPRKCLSICLKNLLFLTREGWPNEEKEIATTNTYDSIIATTKHKQMTACTKHKLL
jgi:hypothetical protein